MRKPTRRDHDSFYHRLFADPRVVAQLIRGFVNVPMLADLDLDAMTPLTTKFHAGTGHRRFSDMVWRIPRHEGEATYLVLMLEFQSRPDQYMAVRLMAYAALLWQQLLKERQIVAGGKLPPLLPVVLYNGDTHWRAPRTVHELIALPDATTFWHYQPQSRYYLIETRVFSEAELLAKESVPALWFRLEATEDPGKYVPMVDDLMAWLERHPGFSELSVIIRDLLAAAIRKIEPDLPIPESLMEVRNLLAERTELWMRKVKTEGRKEGRLEGRQEGRQEGEAALLLRLLRQRFGALPTWATERVQTANPDQVEMWADRMFAAARLTDVIGDPPV